MKTILVTGASGFLGQAICRKLSSNHRIIRFDTNALPDTDDRMIFVRGSIADQDAVQSVTRRYVPDAVVHCAGIAHQRLSTELDEDDYDLVNHVATKNLALAAARVNSEVHFIFLSSISVYGEKQGRSCFKENDICQPTSQYAVSKLKAEKALELLYQHSKIHKVDILRLAPVYDASWSLNLEKRVFAPKKMFYIRFGSGQQKMSVLSRDNLSGFIAFRLENYPFAKSCNTSNICDQSPCSFNEIIQIFKQSHYQPDRSVVRIPLGLIWGVTRAAGMLAKRKSPWIHSFYDKLATDLIVDNKQMLGFGYNPPQSLKSVFMGEN